MRSSRAMRGGSVRRVLSTGLVAAGLLFAGTSVAAVGEASASAGNFCLDLNLASGGTCHSQSHTGYRIVNGRATDTSVGGATCVGIDNLGSTTYMNTCAGRFQTAAWTGYVASGYAFVHNHDTFGTRFRGYLSADN